MNVTIAWRQRLTYSTQCWLPTYRPVYKSRGNTKAYSQLPLVFSIPSLKSLDVITRPLESTNGRIPAAIYKNLKQEHEHRTLSARN